MFEVLETILRKLVQKTQVLSLIRCSLWAKKSNHCLSLPSLNDFDKNHSIINMF